MMGSNFQVRCKKHVFENWGNSFVFRKMLPRVGGIRKFEMPGVKKNVERDAIKSVKNCAAVTLFYINLTISLC